MTSITNGVNINEARHNPFNDCSIRYLEQRRSLIEMILFKLSHNFLNFPLIQVAVCHTWHVWCHDMMVTTPLSQVWCHKRGETDNKQSREGSGELGDASQRWSVTVGRVSCIPWTQVWPVIICILWTCPIESHSSRSQSCSLVSVRVEMQNIFGIYFATLEPNNIPLWC